MPHLPSSKSKLIIKTLFLLILVSPCPAQGLFSSLKEILRLGHRETYNQQKCQSRPQWVYGHFISSKIYPDEIHKFYVNRLRPASRKSLGRHLKPIQRRVLTIDLTQGLRQKPWIIYKAEVCVPNETYLNASYE